MTFNALLATQTSEMVATGIVRFNEDDLMPGDVTLAGIDSVNAPHAVRVQAWSRLVRDLDLDLGKLVQTTRTMGLAEVPQMAIHLLEGGVQGRTVVDVNR